MKRKILSTVIAALFSSVIHTQTVSANSEHTSKVQLTENSFSEDSWLREFLPDTTLLYARIPSLLSTLSSKDDAFKYALGNESYTQAISSIKTAAIEWVKKADPEIQPFLTLLAGQLNGPIEIAAIANGPIPQTLITASLDFESSEEISLLIDKLTKAKVIRGEKTPITDGAGEIITNLGPTPYRWDKESKQLKLLISFGGASIAQLDDVYDSLTANPDSPMLLNEAKMDSSTQGLYIWLNNTVAYPMYSIMTPPHIKQQLSLFGVPFMESLAFSWGVQNEKGRIKLLLEAPQKGVMRKLIPANDNSFEFKTAGTPNLSAVVSLPTTEQFTNIEQTVLSMSRNQQKYLDAKAKLESNLGFSIEDILDSIGPEVVGVSDQTGEYSAIRIGDKDKFNKLLDILKSKHGTLIQTKEVNGSHITHMKLASLISKNITKELKDIPPVVSDILTKANTHLYWQEDNGYLILSDLPQVLIDRQYKIAQDKDAQTLDAWLTQTQKQDLSASMFAVTGSISNSPRRIYYSYLNVIQFLADLTDAQIDPFSFPSAQQLNLAKEGTMGLQIDSGENSLGFEISFESTPADALLTSQGIASIASIGMLSAIAIPAYKDYQFRAHKVQIEQDIEDAKRFVNLSYETTGAMPNQQTVDEFNAQQIFSLSHTLTIKPNTGEIEIDVISKPGKKIMLEPIVENGTLTWNCRSNLSNREQLRGCVNPL